MVLFSFVAALPAMATGVSGREEAKNLIDQKIKCSELSPDQLEKIGDYYMELMAPGQGHEVMDQMMGDQGSDSLRQMHILMARRWYCGDQVGMGMMGMMVGNYGPGTLNWNGGADGQPGTQAQGAMMGYEWGSNMMYGFGYGGGLMIVLYALSVIFLTTGTIAFIKYLSNKR